MKRILIFLALLSPCLVPLEAATTKAKISTSITTDDDPKVIAAKKKRDDAEQALRQATAKNDKAAIIAAEAAKVAAGKELSDARKAAFKAAKDKAADPNKK